MCLSYQRRFCFFFYTFHPHPHLPQIGKLMHPRIVRARAYYQHDSALVVTFAQGVKDAAKHFSARARITSSGHAHVLVNLLYNHSEPIFGMMMPVEYSSTTFQKLASWKKKVALYRTPSPRVIAFEAETDPDSSTIVACSLFAHSKPSLSSWQPRRRICNISEIEE